MEEIKRSGKPSCFIYFQFIPLNQRLEAFRKKYNRRIKHMGTDSLTGIGLEKNSR